MNINLGQWGHLESQAFTMQSDMEEHQEILRHAGYTVVGPPVLVPEPGPDYPGSYQVWSPVLNEKDGHYDWVYIDPDGVALNREFLPLAEDMEVPSGDEDS